MSETLTPNKTDKGWVVEMARAAGVAEGSLIVLYLNGDVAAEILPPATEEMKRSVEESIDKFRDAFAEMKCSSLTE